MTDSLYLPVDEINSGTPNLDLAADYLELSAYLSSESCALVQSLRAETGTVSGNDRGDVDAQIKNMEEVMDGTRKRIRRRMKALGKAYPFTLTRNGQDTLEYIRDNAEEKSSPYALARVAYIVSLVLSNLKSMSPILEESEIHPAEKEERKLRRHFQYFATVAMAGEICGQAWSFGYPRPDRSGFMKKLEEIWSVLKDGVVKDEGYAWASPNDDGVDVFAARMHPDRLSGFLLAAGQVATGQDWRSKPVAAKFPKPFWKLWFSSAPISETVCYHIIPFALPDERFPFHCSSLGIILHRLRVPYRVAEALQLRKEKGLVFEAAERLDEASQWVRDYSQRSSGIIENRHPR